MFNVWQSNSNRNEYRFLVPESGVLLYKYLQMCNGFDTPLNSPVMEIWMLTTHASENSEGRNNQSRKILHEFTEYLSHHVQTVNTNLDFKDTASKSSKDSEKHVIQN